MPRISGSQRGEGVQAVVFALQILEYLAQHRSTVGVTDLARVFDTTKSRMHRHLQTLVAAGYVMREEETERYRSGARLIAFGRAVAENFELTSAARPVMEALRASLGHAVTLSQPEPDGMRVIATIAGKSAFEIGVKPGSMLAAHATAQGKLMLAYGGAAVMERSVARALSRNTPATITDRAALRGEIEEVRRRGWAVAPNQTVIGMNALAAPIFDALGAFVGAVAIVDSIQFIPADPAAKQVRETVAAARKISTTIGLRGV
ncbi:MAG TPA: IclR family transcriptional regulator [Xanthobacteraceae bacterium]|nr:IclR family transcriptional regulator [Xanthobacteraceae bacterium]